MSSLLYTFLCSLVSGTDCGKISLKIYTYSSYSPGARANNPLGSKFYFNRKALSLCPFVASFKIISMKSDFKHICNDFIHVYSPQRRGK